MACVTGGEVVPVPAKFVGGYLESWSTLLPRDLPANYNLVFMAFATLDASGGAVFGVNQDQASLIADIKSRNSQAKPTILSVGGQGGAAAGLGTAAQQDAFIASVVPVIDQYGFSGVDWDLEAGVPGGISASGLATVSRQLKEHYGPSFAITMAPFGDPEVVTVYKALALEIKDILTFVGFQNYNDVSVPTCASVLTTMETWARDCGLRTDQWALGFLHIDDWLSLNTPYATMASIYKDVNMRYPTVRGAWMWGINEKDQPGGFPFANTLGPVVLRARA